MSQGEHDAAQAARLFAQTAAQFPLVTEGIAIGGRGWQITAVQNQDALLDGAHRMEHFPFGLLLWASAVGLGQFLARQPQHVEGRTVLELGAGVGVSGLVAQSLGGVVSQTDHQANALALAERNAAQNAVTGIRRFGGDWRTWAHSTRYDVLLGADILYERTMHYYLEQIFAANLAPQGTLLLSDPGRPQALELISRLEKSGWHFAMETLPVVLPNAEKDEPPVEVGIYIGQR